MRSLRWIPFSVALFICIGEVPVIAGSMRVDVFARDADGPDEVSFTASGVNTPLTRLASLTLATSSASAQATADFNHVGAEAFATGVGGTSPMEAIAFADFFDVLHAFDAAGNELTVGTATGFIHVDGTVIGNADATFGWEFGSAGLGTRWDHRGSSGPPIVIDESYAFSTSLSASGLELILGMRTRAFTNSTGATGHANLFSTGKLASIIYVDPDGNEDRTVQFRGSNGFVYPTPQGPQPIPEPASLTLMGMGLLGSCAFARRKRRTAA